jgi:hypothetical protein
MYRHLPLVSHSYPCKYPILGFTNFIHCFQTLVETMDVSPRLSDSKNVEAAGKVRE